MGSGRGKEDIADCRWAGLRAEIGIGTTMLLQLLLGDGLSGGVSDGVDVATGPGDPVVK